MESHLKYVHLFNFNLTIRYYFFYFNVLSTSTILLVWNYKILSKRLISISLPHTADYIIIKTPIKYNKRTEIKLSIL